jgi:voltage-gated potassium channel Kch
MVLTFRLLKVTDADRWIGVSGWARTTVLSTLVVAMLLAALIEASLWAATYLVVGALSGVERALYFSTVTYTTLGYGDVVIEEQWRLLAAIEAANGIIMFGWTTALIVAAVTHIYLPRIQEKHDV